MLLSVKLRYGVRKAIAICIIVVFAAGAFVSFNHIAQSQAWQNASSSSAQHIKRTRADIITESGATDLGQGSSDMQLQLQGTQNNATANTPHHLATSYAFLNQNKKRPQKEIHPRSQYWDNSVAVCAIMKTENLSDIREWLHYHKWLGVDKIYLRENSNSTLLSKTIAGAFKGLVAEGFLDLGTWPGQSPEAQQLWYNRCAQADLGGAQSWILFSDLDEYPVLLNGGVAVEEPDVKGFLRRHRGAAGLTLQWVMFGSSGIRNRPTPGGPLRHFRKCADELSFEMKCLAASHHLAEKPFIGPAFVHACCYKFKEKQDPEKAAPVLYGNGKRAQNMKLQRVMVPVNTKNPFAESSSRASTCRSYRGHLPGQEYEKNRAVPQGEALVLFHYMTRSFQDFRERKLSRYAGMYVDDFRERRANATRDLGTAPPDEELFDDLEHDLGIDHDAALCSSAADANYAQQCCENV